MYVYAENCQVDEVSDNLKVFNLHEASPDLVKFKETWKNVPKANGDVTSDPVRRQRKDAGKGFKWDAIRFAHKVYSIFHCAKVCDSDILFWMDADTVCHSPIAKETIEKFCQSNIDLGFLGRDGKYTECGLYSMNLRSENVQNFLREFQRMYDDAESGIFTLAEWHDSFVFDAVRTKFNSEWGAYLDHLKGDRKDLGRSKDKDLKVKRTESYWQ